MVNLLNLERVSKAYGVRPLLTEVSLGVGEAERIGIVGRNGDGKTTLLEVMTGHVGPDSGRVSRTRGLDIGYLHQQDQLLDTHSVREAVLGGRADHEWAADPAMRQVVEELLAGGAVAGEGGGEVGCFGHDLGEDGAEVLDDELLSRPDDGVLEVVLEHLPGLVESGAVAVPRSPVLLGLGELVDVRELPPRRGGLGDLLDEGGVKSNGGELP